jgi:glycosyltransferase involved in cell wall biosynthesis
VAQSYQNWDYILVDNCSSDGSSEIAESYARKYPAKIRVVRTESFLTQVQNYNFALSCISPSSKYCKMCQADDWLFPECVARMVCVAEADSSIGIVGAYELAGAEVDLDGLPYPSTMLSGRDACRFCFLNNRYIFGTPTSLLMRSDLVRSRSPFYEERFAPFEDAHVCFDLLTHSNFGFVHQVLTFSRRDNDSMLRRIWRFGFQRFSRFALIVMHGKDYLSVEEYDQCFKAAQYEYFSFLGKSALRGEKEEFWEFHRNGLASINYRLDRRVMSKWVALAMVDYIGNPKHTVDALWDRLTNRRGAPSSSKS